MTTLCKALAVGALGALMWTGMAQAQVQTPGWFGEINGMYAGTSNGSAINSNNVGSSTPGSGAAGSIRLGYRFNSPWDLAIGAFYAKFKDGPHIGAPPVNEWSVTGASIFNLDGEAGYNMGFAWGGLRPFFGVRYQQVQHQMEDTGGSFFTDEGFTPTGLPSGSGNRIVQGPFAGVRYNFGGTPH